MTDRRKQSPELERIRDLPQEPAWTPDDIEDQPDPVEDIAANEPEPEETRDAKAVEQQAFGLANALQNVLMGLKHAQHYAREELPGVDLTVIHEVQEGLRQLVRDLQAKYPL